MEVRKANQQIIQPEIPQKSEVSKTKSSAQNLIPDSFEKENSNSSSSNSSSTASSEPEKKAGQITGGILIKQMTAARIGETNAKQSSEASGKKDLTPEQQSSVSTSDPRKKNLDSSFSLQNARSKDDDRKNSGLQPPFATNIGDASSKFTNVSRVGKDQVISGQNNEQTSDAVKDASRLVDGGTLRSQFDAEVGGRKQDSNALGGSTADRLNDLVDPTTRGSHESGHVGKDQLAYEKTSKESYIGGGYTEFYDAANGDEDGVHIVHNESTYDINKHLVESYKTETHYLNDKSVVVTETETFVEYNKQGNQTKDTTTTTTTTTNADGSTHVETTITTTDEGGKTTTDSHKTDTPAGGGAKSYDPENYTGNFPDEVKKVIDYFKQQAIGQKPQSGGETAHTDDNANADPTVGGRVSNLVAQQGNVGLFGNPGSATSQTGASGGQGHVGSSQSGGDVDFGPDSDQVGYTGPTHEDDPADVQFGPAEQPKAQTETKKSEDADDSSASNLDPLHNKRRDK